MYSRLVTSAVLCIGFCAALMGRSAPAQPTELLTAFQESLVQTIERVEPSVVAISRAPVVADSGPDSDNRLQAGQPQPPEPPPAGAQGALNAPALRFLARDPFRSLRQKAAQSERYVSGAGVVIDRQGLVLTQYLVVKPGDNHFVTTTDGQTHPAKIVGADPRSSLAVLKVETDTLKPIPFGDAHTLKKGALVVVVGNPFSIHQDGAATASYGMVTNLASRAPALENLNNAPLPERNEVDKFRSTLHHFGSLIQTDARLGWSASGGAMVTLDGALVGLTTTVATIAGHEKPAGYAIPINKTIRRVIDNLKEGREVEYGLLGIRFDQKQLQNLSDGNQGVSVGEVIRGSAAARAGLRPNDVIAEIDGQRIDSPDKLQLEVGSLTPGAEAPLVFERNGKRQTTAVRLDKIHVVGKKVITNRPAPWQGLRVDYATALAQADLADSQDLIDPRGCVVVAEVHPGSVSWKHGVRTGMFISHVSGKRVSTPKEFRTAVRDADGNVKLRFTAGNGPAEPKPSIPKPDEAP